MLHGEVGMPETATIENTLTWDDLLKEGGTRLIGRDISYDYKGPARARAGYRGPIERVTRVDSCVSFTLRWRAYRNSPHEKWVMAAPKAISVTTVVEPRPHEHGMILTGVASMERFFLHEEGETLDRSMVIDPDEEREPDYR